MKAFLFLAVFAAPLFSFAVNECPANYRLVTDCSNLSGNLYAPDNINLCAKGKSLIGPQETAIVAVLSDDNSETIASEFQGVAVKVNGKLTAQFSDDSSSFLLTQEAGKDAEVSISVFGKDKGTATYACE